MTESSIMNDLLNIIKETKNQNRKLIDNDSSEGILLSPGIRDDRFYSFIQQILLRAGKFNSVILNKFFTLEHKKLFEKAFTSKEFDSENNYEIYEFIGDSVLGNFFSSYFLKRFPILENSDGVKIIARLKIKYGSKTELSKIASSLQFWDYISCTDEERNKKKIHLLEDVFEAFVGVVYKITENIVGKYQGQQVIFLILEKIFDQINISLNREDLFDFKTILKEYFDKNKNLGELKYQELPKNENLIIITKVYAIQGNNAVLMGIGSGTTKKASEQEAAKKAIAYLKKNKLVPEDES